MLGHTKFFLCFGPIMFQELTKQPGPFILTFIFNFAKITLILDLWYTSQPMQWVQVLVRLTWVCTYGLQLANSKDFLLVTTYGIY